MYAFYQDRAIIHSHQDQIVKMTVVMYDLATFTCNCESSFDCYGKCWCLSNRCKAVELLC